jgi:hypothetical protein
MLYTQAKGFGSRVALTGVAPLVPPRLWDAEGLTAGGDKSNASGDLNEQQKGLYPY